MKAILYRPDTGEVIQRAHGDSEFVQALAEHLGASTLESDDETAIRVLPDGSLVQPDVTTPALPRAPIVLIDFLFLFTQTERITLRRRRPSDPLLDDFWTLLEAADVIHLDHPSVMGGVAYLVSANLLTQARADAILAGQPA